MPNIIEKCDQLVSLKEEPKKLNGFNRKATLTKVQASSTTFTNGKISSTVLNRNTSVSLNSNPLSSYSSSSSTSSSSSSSSQFNPNQQQNLRLMSNKQPITTEL